MSVMGTSPRLMFYLLLTHTLAGAMALVWAAVLSGAPGRALGLLGAALVGGFLSLALRRELALAGEALAKLARGAVVNGGLPQGSLLPDLLGTIRRLAHDAYATGNLRAQLVRQVAATSAQEERNRLARDLHDSVKQQIFSMSVSAAAAQARWDSDPAGAKAALDDVRRSAQAAMAEMRALLQQLAPAPLEKVGLVQALRDQCEALSHRTGAQVEAQFGALPSDERLPPGAQEAVFRIAQEALSNVARHARAAHVRVAMQVGAADGGEWLTLDISDDGQGFAVPDVPRAAHDAVHGMGLGNMHARAAALGGRLTLDSAPGAGTALRLSVPLLTPLPASAPPEPVTETARRLNALIVALRWAGLIALALALFAIASTARLIAERTAGILVIVPVGVVVGAGVVCLLLADTLVARLHLMVGRTSETARRLRVQAAGLVANMFLFLYWTLPFFPLNWGGEPGAAEGALALALVFGVLTALAFGGAGRVYWRYYRALPRDLRRQRLQQAWNDLRISAPLTVLLTVIVLLVTRAQVTLPPHDRGEWINTFFVITLPLVSAGSLGTLAAVGWGRRQTDREQGRDDTNRAGG